MELLHISQNLENSNDKHVKTTLYNLTSAGVSTKTIDHIGDTVHVEAWAHFKQESHNGEQEVLAFITSDGEVFGTISQTFINRFLDIYDIFGFEDFPDITIIGGTSKNGRQFVTCRPA